MTNSFIQKKLPDLRAYLAEQPIDKAWLFGSYSRGEENSDSDVDILVKYDKKAKITLFTISRLTLGLKKLLGKDVDLVEEGCVMPFARAGVEKDQILIYEREN